MRLVARRGDERLDARIGVEGRFHEGRICSFHGRDAWEVAGELGLHEPSR